MESEFRAARLLAKANFCVTMLIFSLFLIVFGAYVVALLELPKARRRLEFPVRVVGALALVGGVLLFILSL